MTPTLGLRIATLLVSSVRLVLVSLATLVLVSLTTLACASGPHPSGATPTVPASCPCGSTSNHQAEGKQAAGANQGDSSETNKTRVAQLLSSEARPAGITVTRDGKAVAVWDEMELQHGDIVETVAGSKFLLHFSAEHADVILNGRNKVRIGSIECGWFCDLFVTGLLGVKWQSASAAPKGTTYHVKRSEGAAEVAVSVIEGHVTLRPNAESEVNVSVDVRWQPLMLAEGQRAIVGAGSPPRPEAIPLEQAQAWGHQVFEGVPRAPEALKRLQTSVRKLPHKLNPEEPEPLDGQWVPDVTGATVQAAIASLKRANLNPDALSQQLDAAARNRLRVVNQRPLPRSVVEQRSVVCLAAVDPSLPSRPNQSCAEKGAQ